MELAIAPRIHSQKNRVHYCNNSLADGNMLCTAGPLQATKSERTSMLRGTLTPLYWRKLACRRVATSICVDHLHSYRTCAMGCKPGACSPRVCTRKSSVLSRELRLV